jgi:hypothetical protein
VIWLFLVLPLAACLAWELSRRTSKAPEVNPDWLGILDEIREAERLLGIPVSLPRSDRELLAAYRSLLPGLLKLVARPEVEPGKAGQLAAAFQFQERTLAIFLGEVPGS